MLDDATPFGISLPDEYISLLQKYNKTKVLDARQLAENLFCLLENNGTPVTLVGSGGVVTYALLSQCGYCPPFVAVAVKREYRQCQGRVEPSYQMERGVDINNILIDDVIASGETVNFVMAEKGRQNLEACALVVSSDTRNRYRNAAGSTVSGIRRVYAGAAVGYRAGKPAIFSARFLLKKVREDPAYRKYLAKYVGGETGKAREIVNGIDLSPFDALYEEPLNFLKVFGGVK